MPGLRCRQMVLACAVLGILVEEYAFDEEHIHVWEQLRKRFHVRVRIAEIGHVPNALAGSDVEDQMAEVVDRLGHRMFSIAVAPLNVDWGRAGRISQYGVLQLA